ncbi:MAG: type III-B CRISPR module RAMP protein Cmr1 [Akkermansiaceae bacterium]|nr:type III-B CRISPR module RAMP protein Cmr1 [Akkermansiaceae bacterium]
MIQITQKLEIISPCFNGGAEPDQRAEIRASSIRGQLRWWFRVLGGFKSLDTPLREQEAAIFGGANDSDDNGVGSKLIVRVVSHNLISNRKDGQELGHANFSDSAFLTFPIQSREKNHVKTTYDGKGVILEGSSFSLLFIWKGLRQEKKNLQALLTIFANLGSLGFRSRRAMGAVAPKDKGLMTLEDAFGAFKSPNNILIKKLTVDSSATNPSSTAISTLGGWLKSWRSYGRTADHIRDEGNTQGRPPENIGFNYAKNDHDIGYGLPNAAQSPAYRPALGLPIIQRADGTKNWEWNTINRKAQGRFASPVILRPHKNLNGSWSALIIFVDSKKWPAGKIVYINHTSRDVSLGLYDAMKADNHLTDFNS